MGMGYESPQSPLALVGFWKDKGRGVLREGGGSGEVAEGALVSLSCSFGVP